MNKILCALTLVLVFACEDQSPNSPDLDLEYYDSMVFDGTERTFYVHLPSSYSDANTYPIVFAMHGGGRLGYEGVEGQSELSELSDREGFIVVYPEGIKRFGYRTWNAGDCCPSATTMGTDDVGFILALLNSLESEWSIDPKRVYATGFSNGGQLAYKLANRYPNTFAAVSAVGGVLQDFPFNPSRKVPIIHFHSYQDSTAPYFGGFSDAPFINLEFPSVDSTLYWIANNYQCGTIKQTVFSDLATYDHFQYTDCDDQARIELYVSRDGGHTWPGGQAFPNMPITNHFNASELMWEFFERYELP